MVGAILILGLAVALWILILLGGAPSRFAWFAFPLTVPVVAAVVLIWTIGTMMFRRRASKQRVLSVAVALAAIYPLTWVFGGFPVAYPANEDRFDVTLAVRVPFDGPVRVLHGGDRLRDNHHVTQPQERWAYDLGIHPIPDEFQSPRPALAAYGCWNAPILAPSAGRVHSTHDAEPDNLPGTHLGIRPDPAGNYVDLEVSSTDTHLLMAHMKRGSVRVSRGQEVAEGDTLGACGSSGNASLPHLHLHHQRTPWVRESAWRLGEGLPLRFRDYVGDEKPHGGGTEDRSGRWRWTGSVLEHQRR